MYSENSRQVIDFYRCLDTEGITSNTVRRFRNIIEGYYRPHGRHDLPWRKTENPYHILVSEIMLQQTQVERVIGKYHQFLSLFPDFYVLAQSPVSSVVKAWKGLGYNRRALALHSISKKIMDNFDGRLPESADLLETLPGIGAATASSILAFAFNKPVIFIETNIRRVFIHFFFPEQENVKDSEILPLVERTLPGSNPRQWYSALMDYGTMMKKKVPNPNIKSAHYTRQSPFEGSRRQLRGRILQALIDRSGITEAVLAVDLDADRDKIREVLQHMQEEGFLQKRGRKFSLA